MKKFIVISSIIFALFAANTINAERYTLKIGDFNEIKVINNVNVVYSNNPDSLGYAVFYGKKEFADAFIFSNKNGCLRIEVSAEKINNPNLPTLQIYSRFLQKVENSSDFKLHIKNLAPSPELKAKLIGNGTIIINNIDATKINAHVSTGNGSIILNGTCSDAVYKMVGTGIIDAIGLKATSVNCAIFGTGEIKCWATESLKSKGVGTTKIFYIGTPKTIKKSGGGNLIQCSENETIEEESTTIEE